LGAVHLIYTAERVFPAAFENILFKLVHLRLTNARGSVAPAASVLAPVVEPSAGGGAYPDRLN